MGASRTNDRTLAGYTTADEVATAIATAVAALPPFPTALVASRKGTITTRQSTTVFANDLAIAVSVNSGVNYTVRGVVWFATTVAAGFKWQLTGPAVTSLQVQSSLVAPAATVFSAIAIDTAFSVAKTIVVAATTPGIIRFEINVVPSAGGTINLQWAQNVSDVSDTSVLAGSYIEVL